MRVILRTFGPTFTGKELRRMNDAGELGEHGGCWVNDWDCGRDCPMATYPGVAVEIVRPEVHFSVDTFLPY